MNMVCVIKPIVFCYSKPLRKTQKSKCIQAMKTNLNKEMKFVNDHCDTNVLKTECIESWQRISLQTNYIYELIKTYEDDE